MEKLLQAVVGKQELLQAISLSVLIFARLAFAVFFTPFWGGRLVPARIKMGISAALVILLYPALSKSLPEPLPASTVVFMLLFVKECFIGLLLGLSISMVFYGIQAAGQFIDNQRGVSMAVIFNPALGNQASLSAQFLFQLTVVLFFVLGGHRIYLTALMHSFEVVPLVIYPNIHPEFSDPTLLVMTKLMASVFYIAIQLSAPIAIAMFLVEVVLGMANRVSPQMDVQFLSYVMKSMIGLLIMFVSLHLIVWQTNRLFGEHLGIVKQMVNSLTGH